MRVLEALDATRTSAYPQNDHVDGATRTNPSGDLLSGGRVAGPPGLPPASNLTPTGLVGWTEATFVTTLRTGRRQDVSELAEFMPGRQYRHMTDDDLTALWRYLQGVRPKEFRGN